MSFFGFTRYQCLGCGERFTIREAKRATSNCPRCLTPVDQHEPVPVSQGGPRFLVRVYKVEPRWRGFSPVRYVPKNLEKEQQALAGAGWSIKGQYAYHIEVDHVDYGKNTRVYDICSVVFVRIGDNDAGPFALPVRKYTPGRRTYMNEERMFASARELAKEGLLITNLVKDKKGFLVFAEYTAVESLV